MLGACAFSQVGGYPTEPLVKINMAGLVTPS
jgi:hypothetical protein